MANKNVVITEPTLQNFSLIQIRPDPSGGTAHVGFMHYPADGGPIELNPADLIAGEGAAIISGLNAMVAAYKRKRGF